MSEVSHVQGRFCPATMQGHTHIHRNTSLSVCSAKIPETLSQVPFNCNQCVQSVYKHITMPTLAS